MAHYATTKPPPLPERTGTAASLRVQILATEHWSQHRYFYRMYLVCYVTYRVH
jgi:hypothetical protein